MSRVIVGAAIAILLSCSLRVAAQARLTGADLDGVVRDESGGVIPGTTITVINLATSVTRTATTDLRGRYVVPALPPGRYTVSAEITGFAKTAHENQELQLGESVTLDFTMKVAGIAEAVIVQAETPLVKVHDASVSRVINSRQIDGLPINGRNFISFTVITAGTTQDNTPQQGASATSGLSFAGQRARSNNIMVDGLDNNDASLGAVRAVFSQEAIREFQVLTSSYSAEFGKATGGVVNIITKSGTNQFHGNAFGYFRDRSLNSKSHFEEVDLFGNAVDLGKSPFRQGQWGGTLGGPLKKSKSFFFLSFERLDATDSNLVTITAEDAAVLNAAGFPVQTGANPFDVKQTQALGKIDHQWQPNSSIAVRANFSDITNENVEPFGGLVARSRGAVRLATDYSFSASQSNVLSNRQVNEARIQYARQDQRINSLDPACGGSCSDDSSGGPTLEIGRISVGRQRFTPQVRVPDRVQLIDTMSLFLGNHQMKAGVDFNHIKSHDSLPLHFGGRYIFGSVAAVAAGTPAAYVQGFGNPSTTSSVEDFSGFLQDEWRATSRLTIKPGLRYQAQFFPDRQYDVSAPGGSRFAYDFPTDYNNVAPRIAISFDPTGSGRTALHGSYGIFYDNVLTGIVFITDSIDGSANGVRTLVQTGALAAEAWRSPGHRLTEAQALALRNGVPFPSLVISIDPSMQTPYAHQASFGFDHAMDNDLSLSVNFISVRGKHQLGTIDYNPVIPALGPGRRPNDVGGVAGTSAQVLQYTSFGETWYKGLVVTVAKRYRRGSQLLASYTLSKAEDNSTDFQSAFVPQNMGFGRNPADPTGLPLGGPPMCTAAGGCQLAFDPLAERGPSVWDQRHRLVLSGIYEFPSAVQLSAIATFASGRPFSVLTGVDSNGDGNGGAAPPDRARTNPSDISTSLGRNSENLPAQITADVRLSRKFSIGGNRSVEAMFEVFNLFNRANYSDVNNIFGTGAFPTDPARDAEGRVTYGLLTQTLPPRQIQLAMKFNF